LYLFSSFDSPAYAVQRNVSLFGGLFFSPIVMFSCQLLCFLAYLIAFLTLLSGLETNTGFGACLDLEMVAVMNSCVEEWMRMIKRK
jgi:hypothetical protein